VVFSIPFYLYKALLQLTGPMKALSQQDCCPGSSDFTKFPSQGLLNVVVLKIQLRLLSAFFTNFV
jgi:hypothetical protein